MFTQNFTGTGFSLELLKIGERGIVNQLRNADETIIKKLMAMGITLGTAILLEQRFPSFVIKAGHTRLALDKEIARSIYVWVKEGE